MTAQPPRIRLVEWPVPHPPSWELCNVAGAESFGVPVLPDDQLVLLFPPDTGAELLATWVELLLCEGCAVILPGDSA